MGSPIPALPIPASSFPTAPSLRVQPSSCIPSLAQHRPGPSIAPGPALFGPRARSEYLGPVPRTLGLLWGLAGLLPKALPLSWSPPPAAGRLVPAAFTPWGLVRRETLLQLQGENRRLCQQEAADRERQEELQRHLEEANRARHQLETQLR